MITLIAFHLNKKKTIVINEPRISTANDPNNKPEIGNVKNDFLFFKEVDSNNREKEAKAVISVLREKYVGKCSRKDIVKLLGDDFTEDKTSDAPVSKENVGLSYLVKRENAGARTLTFYLHLQFDDKGILYTPYIYNIMTVR
jgi:hypothetical protein